MIDMNLHGGNLLIEDEKVSARISDVGLYEPLKNKRDDERFEISDYTPNFNSELM
uniref:Protein kinase domain-containing protein n=1 Tax=Rhizophagus irregularis (strain DAOM 181602 / DAOM 197198 / MUCL 43194) TaxID=747089 RepID=U9TDE5_RHIID